MYLILIILKKWKKNQFCFGNLSSTVFINSHIFPFLFLFSILAEAKNLSFNATAAFHAYTNIKDKIDAAEKEAKEAKQKASDALELVRPQNDVWVFLYPRSIY